MALIYIEDKALNVNGRNLLDLGLPRENRNIDLRQRNIVQERSYDIVEAFTTIMDNLENNSGGIFYLDAPGGTGKTFVIKLILAKVRQSWKIAIAVASSGIAATLLPGGRTAHSVFRLPLDLAQRSQASCTISKNSGKAKLLRETTLIVWDECTMAHAKALETVDITLKDVRDSNRLMGGILVLLAGDFRQTIPVIRRSTPADELRASLKSSSLWPLVKTLKLKLNMRAQLASEEDTSRFAVQLLQLGERKNLPMIDGLITFPPGFCQIVRNVSDLKARVFENLQDNFANHEWLCERAILAPKNDMVDSVNFEILQSFPGLAYTYKSFD
uniref:ATP-dependent DNA helicase n=1 Tax=Lutzomyia longipalpis TaxID=7200 RepID=A0A1B0CJG8_LUTLO